MDQDDDEDDEQPITIEPTPEPQQEQEEPFTLGLDENKLDELGTEQDVDLERDVPEPKSDKIFLCCQKCESSRQEILWIEQGQMLTRCLGCGYIISFVIDPKLIPRIKRRNGKKKTTPSYFG